jgi:hypothetical protein
MPSILELHTADQFVHMLAVKHNLGMDCLQWLRLQFDEDILSGHLVMFWSAKE